MKRGRPIKPEEIKKKVKEIPDFVYDIFNEIIETNYDNKNDIKVLQKDVVVLITKKHGSKDWPIYWLDVEDSYRKVGWNVTYDKPAYYESYDSYFVFTKPN